MQMNKTNFDLNYTLIIFLIAIVTEPFMNILSLNYFLNFKNSDKIQISDIFIVVCFILLVFDYKKYDFKGFLKEYFYNYAFLLIFIGIILFLNFFNNNLYGLLKFILLTCYFVCSFTIIRKIGIKLISNFIFYYFILLSTLILIFYFLQVFQIFENSYLIKKYENFPIFGEVLRLIGPHKPTSKLFATYLFFIVIFVELYAKNIKKYLYIYVNLIVFLLSLLTFSRPGFCVCFFIVVNFLLRHKENLMSSILFILFFIFIISISVMHPDVNNLFIKCKISYAPLSDQYYGWYEKPQYCHFIFDVNIFENTYLVLKKIFLNEINIKTLLIGNGTGSFMSTFLNYAEVGKISSHYAAYPFPLVQSSLMTLVFEYGLIACLLYVFFILVNLPKIKDKFIFYWLMLFLLITIDLDIQHFRFIYIMLPIIYFSSINLYNEKN